MPHDRLMYPTRDTRRPTFSKNPVEMAKHILDSRDIKYNGEYLPIDDTYIINIIQKRPIPDWMFKAIRQLGFYNTGKKKFFYKRYNIIQQAQEVPEPIYGDGTFDAQPLNPAPDPFYLDRNY